MMSSNTTVSQMTEIS